MNLYSKHTLKQESNAVLQLSVFFNYFPYEQL